MGRIRRARRMTSDGVRWRGDQWRRRRVALRGGFKNDGAPSAVCQSLGESLVRARVRDANPLCAVMVRVFPDARACARTDERKGARFRSKQVVTSERERTGTDPTVPVRRWVKGEEGEGGTRG